MCVCAGGGEVSFIYIYICSLQFLHPRGSPLCVCVCVCVGGGWGGGGSDYIIFIYIFVAFGFYTLEAHHLVCVSVAKVDAVAGEKDRQSMDQL